MHWYVLHVKPRWELKVFRALRDRGIEAYCPSYTDVRQWSDRRKKVRCPYFNGYVFVRLKEAERNRVFGIPGIVRYVFCQGKAAIVQEAEMLLMKAHLDGGSLEDVRMQQLTLGDEVRFSNGTFKGRTAHVEAIGKSGVRLVLPVLGYRITARRAELISL